ncbi:hypothetical protein ASE11_06595 [Hydrogenophaga sp. Root209]|uniref:hypothetical protein n=1 Tax=Hydrogenophaga sp. Root209 TaxID=1736490 RepID=UPI0006F5219C|nr:hypothetical protein [Hydrogenophaga sp. Root209]KRC01277.1 hypothetical protein ASE11_06595 [Hydrogenophaga sp. Root209]
MNANDLIPDRYHGVWQRTLLQTPATHDTTTWVRWLQTGLWHGDLRVPPEADRTTPAGRAEQQGFGGTTLITHPDAGQPEVCTWQRQIDLQPPRSTPDAGHMVFEAPDCVHETGIHGQYFEVWERLPGSLGTRIALAALDATGAPTAERLLVAGRYLMHLRPRSAAWPAGTAPDDSLAEVVARHPQRAEDLLDFDISFGTLEHGVWTIERASVPALEGRVDSVTVQRKDQHTAWVGSARLPQRWQVLEWHAVDAPD